MKREITPWRLIPRHRIDLSASDFLRLTRAQFALRRHHASFLAEAAWDQNEPGTSESGAASVVAAFSVRTVFDAVLQALNLQAGSEIIISALTIPDMPRIIRAHGLVPVSIDIDLETLTPNYASIERAVTDRTRAVIIAQLFGGHSSLESARRACDKFGLTLIEDSAQSVSSSAHWNDPNAHVSLASFGPIKTATSLGGSISVFGDQLLQQGVRNILATYPVQSRRSYLKRSIKYGVLALLARPLVYGTLWRCLARRNIDCDALVAAAGRTFGTLNTEQLLLSIRKQPCAPMLSMLSYRGRRFPTNRILNRAVSGRQILRAIPESQTCGQQQSRQTHWVLPILADDCDELVHYLRSNGIDACRAGTTSIAVADTSASTPNATRIATASVWLPTAHSTRTQSVIANVLGDPRRAGIVKSTPSSTIA